MTCVRQTLRLDQDLGHHTARTHGEVRVRKEAHRSTYASVLPAHPDRCFPLPLVGAEMSTPLVNVSRGNLPLPSVYADVVTNCTGDVIQVPVPGRRNHGHCVDGRL